VPERTDDGCHLLPVARVGDEDLVLGTGQLVDQLSQLRLAAGDQPEHGAAPCERLGDRAPQPARGASHEYARAGPDLHAKDAK
jgi:hypothetical protein